MCLEKGIHLTAYSRESFIYSQCPPCDVTDWDEHLGSALGRPSADKPSPLLIDELVVKLSEKYNKTPAAVLLSWIAQRGNWSVVPKSANPERMKANLEVSFCAMVRVPSRKGMKLI